jgi:hypothetical protein
MTKPNLLKLILVFIGGFLGPLNIALFMVVGSKLNHSAFYEKMTSNETFIMFSGFWYYLMFLPCLLSTALTLLVMWSSFLGLKTTRHHILWGIMFGVIATIFSTGFLILSGVLYNYWRGTSSAGESFMGLLLTVPGGFVLGMIFILLFSPALVVAGPAYGLVAMSLKKKFLS